MLCFNWILHIFLCSRLVFVSSQLIGPIYLGGLFDVNDHEQEEAFKVAVQVVTSDTKILPSARLFAEIRRLGPDESFRATKEVCSLLEKGIAGIFGPQSDVTSMHVQAICDAFDVPHIETRWDFQLQRDDLSINLFPRPSVLSRAYIDLVKYWRWDEFALVYEEQEGIIRLQDFLREAQRQKWRIRLYQFSPEEPYRELFIRIKKETKIVLDVRREKIQQVLKHDFHTIDLEDFRYGRTNITGYRLVKPDYGEHQKLLKHLKRASVHKISSVMDAIRTETALMYDAVKLFATALQDIADSKTITFEPLSCETGMRGSDGTSVINSLKHIDIQGLTGKVIFDSEGFRSSDFVLDILQLTKYNTEVIGYWTPEKGVNITKIISELNDPYSSRKTLRVAVVLNDPYVMLKESTEILTGNDRYEGYCIDLIEKLAEDLEFNYVLMETPDGKHGKEENGEWNGIIKQLRDDNADIGLVDLTITSSRETQVDFTMPFMTTGISILFKKSATKETSLFSFLSPFSMEVWVYVMAAYMGVSITLFLVGRLSPYEWDNPHPCRQDDQVLENSFSMLNSMWFTIGSLMQQGSDIAPKAMSTRTIAGIWYFFTLIMISSYTANLAAFLTVETSVDPFSKAEELVNQTDIEFGCLKDGATHAFFKDSKVDSYQKIFKHMAANSDLYVESNTEGINRVLKGNYAYFMEYTTIEYQKERKCNLTNIGGLLDNKGYGIATQKDSPYRAMLSNGILKLQEAGVLLQLRDRWWKQKRGGGKCREDSKKSSNVTELGLGNVGGVFVVLLVGLTMATVVAILEFLWKARKQAATDREPVLKEMLRELKFALYCQSSIKPVRKKPEVESNGDFNIDTLPEEFTADY